MEKPLEKEFRYYLAHQDEFVAKHLGKFVVIKDEKLIGVFDDEDDAICETEKKHPLGTFLVQQAEPGTEGYTQTFHSRVAFE